MSFVDGSIELFEAQDSIEKARIVALEMLDKYEVQGDVEPMESGLVLSHEAWEKKDEKTIGFIAWTLDYLKIITMMRITVDYVLQAKEAMKRLADEIEPKESSEVDG